MADAKRVLITGGSGLIGTRLTGMLLDKGHTVSHLGRSDKNKAVKTFLWNPEKNYIDRSALHDVDVVVHLAGAGIADKRWNEKQKQEILESRTQTARLLRDALIKEDRRVRVFVSASGINYYGLTDPGSAFVESDPPGHDFMAHVTRAWENEADAFGSLGMRVVKMRTGVALDRESKALQKIAMPVKFFVGAPLGKGSQYFNWIHLDDLSRIYLKAIEDDFMQGAYNAVAPHPVTNKELTSEIAKVLKRPLWLPPVPGFVVKLIAGEVADIVLKGGKVSCNKIQAAGFDFQFGTVRSALQDIFATKAQRH